MLLVASSAYAIKIVGGPVLQNVTENSFSIVWTTDKNAVAWVEIAPDDDMHFYAFERPKYFQTVLGRKCIGKNHCVTVPRLEKGTTYRYRIYTQEVTGKGSRMRYGRVAASRIFRGRPFYATTLNPDKESVNCLIMNDSHGSAELETVLKNKFGGKKLKEVRNTDMVIYNGGMSSTENTYVYRIWKNFLDTSVKYFAKDVPLVVGRGASESLGNLGYMYNTSFPSDTNNPYRIIRQGPVCFILLDSGYDLKDNVENTDFTSYREQQAIWLKNALQSPTVKEAKYRVALMHIPPVSKAAPVGKALNKLFVPILNEAGIDIMLCGYTEKHRLSKTSKSIKFPILENAPLNVITLNADSQEMTLTIEDILGNQVDKLSFKPSK